ncbi:MAG: hypothetical protein ACK4SY_08360 [Pyrobaculum sp.]
MRLSLCRTKSLLDYRPVVFLDGEGYVELVSTDGRRVVARVMKGPCVGVSREVAYLLYPYYGWDILDIDAEFSIREVNPPEAARVVMKVPFGIGEAVVRRQLAGFPIYEGTVALEYLEHVEFGEVAHVEPRPFSILTDNTRLRLVETPVEDTDVVFAQRRRPQF